MANVMSSRGVDERFESTVAAGREVNISDIASGVRQWADSGASFGDIMRATGKEFFVNRPKAKVEERTESVRERVQGLRDRVRSSMSRLADEVAVGSDAAYSASASMLNVPAASTIRLTGSMSERAHGGMDVLRDLSNAVSARAQAFGRGVSDTVAVAREQGMLAGAGYGLSRAGLGVAKGVRNVGSSVVERLGQGYAAFRESHADEIADLKRSLNELRSEAATRKDMFVSDHLTGYARMQRGRSAVGSLFARATGFMGRKFSEMSERLGHVPEAAEQAVERHAAQRGTFMDTSERLERLSESEFVALANIVNGPEGVSEVAGAREAGESVFAVGSAEVGRYLDELVESDGSRHGEFEQAVERVARDRYGDDKVDLMVRTVESFGHEGVGVADAVRICESDRAVASVYAADAHDLDERAASMPDSGESVVLGSDVESDKDSLLFETYDGPDDVFEAPEEFSVTPDRDQVEAVRVADEDVIYPVMYAEDFEAEGTDLDREAPVFQVEGVERDGAGSSYEK